MERKSLISFELVCSSFIIMIIIIVVVNVIILFYFIIIIFCESYNHLEKVMVSPLITTITTN